MTKKQSVRKRAPKKPPATAPMPNPLAATPEQIEMAQEQARQRLLMEFNVLKGKFADESIARTVAETQNQQLIERLRAAQTTIEKLTEDNRKHQVAASAKVAEGAAPPDVEQPAPEDDPAARAEES